MSETLNRLRVLVNTESGTDNLEGRNCVAAILADWASDVGCDVELVPHEVGDHLVAKLPGVGSGRIVLLGHHDTVFNVGESRRFEVAGDIAYGGGVADMKGGLLAGLVALEALAQGERPFESVELFSVPDEEIRRTPFATLNLAAGAKAALVLECGRENGDVVVGRNVGGWVRLGFAGRPAHAGTTPEEGRSAVSAACREALRCQDLNGARDGLTVIVGTISGGTWANVVPATAEMVLDVRAPRSVDFEWALAQIGEHRSYDGVQVQVEDMGSWPGIEPSEAGAALFGEAVRIARGLGLHLDGQTSGGMSDGCWTAAAGVPTLDGLGPVGGADHTPNEFMLVESVPPRCGVIVGLCEAIGRGLLLEEHSVREEVKGRGVNSRQ